MNFGSRANGIGREHQPEAAGRRIEGAIAERQRLRIHFAGLEIVEAQSPRLALGDGDHIRREIDRNHASAGPHALCRRRSGIPGAARDIESQHSWANAGGGA